MKGSPRHWHDNGPVHKGANHIPKAISDHDLLPDWVCDLNCVCSQALQTANCRLRTIASGLRADFASSAHFQCTRMNDVPKELCVYKSSESGLLGRSRSKMQFFRVAKA